MIVKNIERRIKINQMVSMGAIALSALVVIAGLFFSYSLIQDSRKSIYVMDNGVPVLATQTDALLNRPVEYKAQIELYHRLFFTIVPDDTYIKRNMEKALYLIDESGKKEYANLREKGFYNQIISSNATISVQVDSIHLDLAELKYTYYGKQLINRKSSLVTRKLITEGNIENIHRTDNNPHGVLLTQWRILDNSEISSKKRYNY